MVRAQEDDLAHYGRSLRRRGTARRQASRPLQSDADLPGSSLRATAGSVGPRTQLLKPFQASPPGDLCHSSDICWSWGEILGPHSWESPHTPLHQAYP